MRCDDPGVCSGSEQFFDTPSAIAKSMLCYVTSCGRFFTEYGYRVERENYHNYMLFYILNGKLSVTNEGRTRIADAGKIGFINCNKPHEYHTIGNAEFLWVHLEGGNTDKFYQHIVQLYGSFVFAHPHANEFERKLSQLIRSYQTGQFLGEAEKSKQLYTLLILLFDGTTADASDGDGNLISTLDAALKFIENNYQKNISLQDIANVVSISPYHFSRIFKKAYGYSPHEYLMMVRINRAKHLLKTTDDPIKVIAQQVGYPNPSTFTSAFTEKVGLSPKQFRIFPL